MRFLLFAMAAIFGTSALAFEDVDGSFTRLSNANQLALSNLLELKLFDARTARLRNVRNLELFTTDICGLVNAKNQMGAYVGYRRFVADLVIGYVFIDNGDKLDGPDKILSNRGIRHCKG